MDDIRPTLESVLQELRNHRPLRGRSAERVAHLSQMALRAPSPETLRRALGEIECCYQSQGRGIDLRSLRHLGRG